MRGRRATMGQRAPRQRLTFANVLLGYAVLLYVSKGLLLGWYGHGWIWPVTEGLPMSPEEWGWAPTVFEAMQLVVVVGLFVAGLVLRRRPSGRGLEIVVAVTAASVGSVLWMSLRLWKSYDVSSAYLLFDWPHVDRFHPMSTVVILALGIAATRRVIARRPPSIPRRPQP